MTVAAVFAIIDLVGVGLEYAEKIAMLAEMSDEDVEAVRAEANRLRKEAIERMENTE